MSTEPNDFSFDPNQRRLCPDGACVGVIGEDGKCKVCGTVDPAGPPEIKTSEAQPIAPEPPPVASSAPADENAFDPNRRLCADETCVGVLDAEGRCKVCGRQG